MSRNTDANKKAHKKKLDQKKTKSTRCRSRT